MMKKIILPSSIYKITQKEDLNQIYKKINRFNLSNILQYTLILEDYDKLNEIIDDSIQKIKDKKNKEILNYYKCLYYIHNHENYNVEKLYIRLNEKHKVILDLERCTTTSQQVKIFEEKILSKLNLLKIKLNYDVLTYTLYLLNLLRSNPKRKKILEKRLLLHIRVILFKKKLGINDILFLSQIISLTNNFYIMNIGNKSEFPISLSLLKKLVYKMKSNVLNYQEILNDKIIKYNETICMGLRTLLSTSPRKTEQKKYLDELKKFIQNNEVEEYTKFIFKVSTSENREELENIDLYINEIKKIVEKENEGDIMHTIYLCCSFIKENKIEEFYTEYCTIEYKGNNSSIKDSLELGKLILKFWVDEKINISSFKNNMWTSNQFRLFVLLDNQQITYTEFLQELEKVEHIEVFSIFSWKRIDKLFEKYNYEWLILILKKINPQEIDWKFKNYLLNFYVNLINRKKHLFFNDFKQINDLILKKNNSIDFQMYSIVTVLNIYGYYDESIKYIILNVLEQLDEKDKIDPQIIESFIWSSLYFTHKKADELNTGLVRKMIVNNIIGRKKALLLLVLYFNNNSIIPQNEYDEISKEIYNIFLNKDKNDIDEVEFSMISHIAGIILRKDETNATHYNDIIYHEGNKVMVHEKDYMEDYEKVYRTLNIKKQRKISQTATSDNLLYLVICRIFFANVERFGVGKMIQISTELSGEEFMNKLLKETGYYERQGIIQKIKNGEEVKTLWLNEFNLYDLMKDIKSRVDNKYKNTKNKLIQNEKIIIHITTLLLLARLGIINKIKDSTMYFVTNKTFKEIEKLYKQHIESTENKLSGFIEDDICCDDYIKEIYDTLKELKNKKQIEYVSSANILGMKEIDKFNQFDEEFLKILSTYKIDNLFYIMTEEPFYFKTEITRNISNGTYSLIINMLIKKIISTKEFYEATIILKDLNYPLKIDMSAYKYILNLASDSWIKKTVKILNEYNK